MTSQIHVGYFVFCLITYLQKHVMFNVITHPSLTPMVRTHFSSFLAGSPFPASSVTSVKDIYLKDILMRSRLSARAILLLGATKCFRPKFKTSCFVIHVDATIW